MSKTGVVKNWNDEKGFGFIGPDDGGEDVFCHSSGLTGGAKGLGKGDRVCFSTEFDDRKGKMRASNVSLDSSGGGGYGGGGYGGGRGGGGGRDYGGRDDRYGGGGDRYGGGRDRDDRYGGGRDDRHGGGRDRDDRYGGGRDRDRGYGGRDGGDRYGGRDRDDRGGGGRSERFGGDTRGDDISSGGREHLTARELYMRKQREQASSRGGRRRSPSDSRSRSPPKKLRRDANFA